MLQGAPALECSRTVYSRSRRGHGVRVDGGLGGTKTAAASESLGFHLQPRHMPLDRKGHRVTPGTKRPNSVACFVFHLCIRTPSGIDTVLVTWRSAVILNLVFGCWVQNLHKRCRYLPCQTAVRETAKRSRRSGAGVVYFLCYNTATWVLLQRSLIFCKLRSPHCIAAWKRLEFQLSSSAFKVSTQSKAFMKAQ